MSAIWLRAGAVAGTTTDHPMELPPANAGQFVQALERFARRLLTDRFELLIVEAQEAHVRLLRAILL